MGTSVDLLILVGVFTLIWLYSRAMARFEYRPRRVVRKQFGVFAVPKPDRQEPKRDAGRVQLQENTHTPDTRQPEGAFRG